jgi:hypothetical protein
LLPIFLEGRRADLKVSSGPLARSSIAAITFPSRYAAGKPPVKGGFPIALLVILVTLSVIASLGLVITRRRRKLHQIVAPQ